MFDYPLCHVCLVCAACLRAGARAAAVVSVESGVGLREDGAPVRRAHGARGERRAQMKNYYCTGGTEVL